MATSWKLKTSLPSLAQNVMQLIDCEIEEEKSSHFAKVTKDLGLNKDVPKSLNTVLKELLQLAYAGLTETQHVFTEVMGHYLKTSENRSLVFTSTSGRDLLLRLIFSTTWADEKTAASARAALNELTKDFSGMFQLGSC
jgi:hypothetical protein